MEGSSSQRPCVSLAAPPRAEQFARSLRPTAVPNEVSESGQVQTQSGSAIDSTNLEGMVGFGQEQVLTSPTGGQPC